MSASVCVCVNSGAEGVQTGNTMDKTAAMLLVTHGDKNKGKKNAPKETKKRS